MFGLIRKLIKIYFRLWFNLKTLENFFIYVRSKGRVWCDWNLFKKKDQLIKQLSQKHFMKVLLNYNIEGN